MDNEKIGNFIKRLRQQENMTQKELGEKLNVTDKAVSKWERGLSFPDITILNSLAEIFHITASEILNGELGNTQDTDVERKIQEAIEKITCSKEKKEKRIKKTKKVIKIVSIILFVFCILLQLGFMTILKKYNFEYVIDSLYYIVNEIILLSGTVIVSGFIKKNRIKQGIVYGFIIIATIINMVFMIHNGFTNKSILSISSDFSNELVLKQNQMTGVVTVYNKNLFFVFAKPKEQLSKEVGKGIKTKWLTNDICSVTYIDKNGELQEYVATYGDRGNGISYYYVTSAIQGDWQAMNQSENITKLIVDTKGITVKRDGKNELFPYENCKQFGTIALVLYHETIPKYVIALDKNCKLDETTGIVKGGGTITLEEVSIENKKTETLSCITYKNDESMDNYKVVDVGENEYRIKNGILYMSYDGKNVIEVPGDFSNMESRYEKNSYQISKEKTIFFYISNQQRYLVYSDDGGDHWETVPMENKSTIETIQFINSNIGFMLKFEDVAMGDAFGEISKTVDGGKTWINISHGIGEKDEKRLKTSSQIKFIDENIGFLTMPHTMGDYCELYVTKDSGETFSKINIEESDIYDNYSLPEEKEGKLYVKVSQGTDGDYHGGDSKQYYSVDRADTWKLVE